MRLIYTRSHILVLLLAGTFFRSVHLKRSNQTAHLLDPPTSRNAALPLLVHPQRSGDLGAPPTVLGYE